MPPDECRVFLLDVKITPGDTNQHSAGLFGGPALDFMIECTIFIGVLWVYTDYSPLYSRSDPLGT